jgi:hypothetical protein
VAAPEATKSPRQDKDESRSLAGLLKTKEALLAIVAIIGASATFVGWTGKAIDRIRGDDDGSIPVGTLSVSKEHIVPGGGAAEFSADGNVNDVGGKACLLRWRSFDGTNDAPLSKRFSGAREIALQSRVCVVHETFRVPAPSTDSMYVEVTLYDDSEHRLTKAQKSETLELAHP